MVDLHSKLTPPLPANRCPKPAVIQDALRMKHFMLPTTKTVLSAITSSYLAGGRGRGNLNGLG